MSDQGERGERGDQGVRGDQGLRGRRGAAGGTGLTGEQGVAGQDSAMSTAHIKGLLKTMRNLMVAVAFFGVLSIGYVEKNRYEGCERGKKDRVTNAAAWTKHAAYINSVLRAPSVKEDVKRAARDAQLTYLMASKDLTTRSRISCAPFGL